MSVEAITCALRVKLPPGNSTAKHVLTILANHASGDPYTEGDVEAWPSIAKLVDSTGQDRKTIIGNLQKLVGWGLIEDTGRRVGRTGQIVVYALHIGPDLLSQASQYRNGSKNGTVTAAKGSQFSGETVPILDGNSTDIGTRNRQEPSGKEDISPAGARETIHHDATGALEGHASPSQATAIPSAAGAMARALRQRGFRITSQHPDLLAAVSEGVTPEMVIEFAELYPAEHEKCRGSPGYVITACRRQNAQTAEPIHAATGKSSHATSASGRRESLADGVHSPIPDYDGADDRTILDGQATRHTRG